MPRLNDYDSAPLSRKELAAQKNALKRKESVHQKAGMRKTFMNIGLAVKERRMTLEESSKDKERRFIWLKASASVACLALLGALTFFAIRPLIPKAAPQPVRSAAALKWHEIAPDSKDFTQPAATALKIFGAAERKGMEGVVQTLGRNLPPEMADEFTGTFNLFKGGELTIGTVRKKMDDPSGRYEVFCKSTSNGHRLKLLLAGEDGALKLTGVGMVP